MSTENTISLNDPKCVDASRMYDTRGHSQYRSILGQINSNFVDWICLQAYPVQLVNGLWHGVKNSI